MNRNLKVFVKLLSVYNVYSLIVHYSILNSSPSRTLNLFLPLYAHVDQQDKGLCCNLSMYFTVLCSADADYMIIKNI